MKLKQAGYLKTTQNLNLTPQLRQAIALLQLSNLELKSFIEQTTLDNPLLQIDEPESNASILLAAQEYSERNYWDNVRKKSRNFDEALDGYIDNIEAKPTTLHEHVLNQISLYIKPEKEKIIAYKLVELLDPTGYFLTELEPLAEQLSTDLSTINSVLSILQTFEPAGIFARNLKECLLLQLREMENLPHQTTTVIENLELLADNKIEKLQKICGINRDQLVNITRRIKELNPKPGLVFENPYNFGIIPDVILDYHEQTNQWSLYINDRSMPRIALDATYVSRLNNPVAQTEEKKYLKDHYQNATSLIKALEQRTKTILKVATIVFEHQKEFFENGIQYLKPLTLKVIADAIDMHESSISRVTQNKYIMTPRGLFEFRYFFSSSLTKESTGEELSSTTIRHMIKKIIDEEIPHDPVSDDKLVQIISRDGVLVARRTIAKYREEMKIPSSYERKKLKLSIL